MNPEAVIGRELEAGETLLWAGRPRQGVVLRPSDGFLIPFSLLWGGFAIFWELGALGMFFAGDSNAPDPIRFVFPIFGLPFVFVGLYFIAGRFFLDARIRANTVYGLTDRRAIIVSGLWARQTNSLPLKRLSDVSVIERADRSGTIALGPSPFSATMYEGMPWPGMGQRMPPRFEMIPNVKDVYAMMQLGRD